MDRDLSAIHFIPPPFNQTLLHEPVDQLDRAVVPNLQALRQGTYCRLQITRQTTYVQNQVVLQTLRADVTGAISVTFHETSDLIVKFRQGGKVEPIHILWDRHMDTSLGAPRSQACARLCGSFKYR